MPGTLDSPGDHVITVETPAFAAAAEIPIYRAQGAGVIVAAFWVPSAAVTHDATNFSTLAIRNRTTGAGTALPATRVYSATDSVAFVAEAMTLDATLANTQFAALDILTVKVTEAGTGLTLPAGYIDLHIRWR